MAQFKPRKCNKKKDPVEVLNICMKRIKALHSLYGDEFQDFGVFQAFREGVLIAAKYISGHTTREDLEIAIFASSGEKVLHNWLRLHKLGFSFDEASFEEWRETEEGTQLTLTVPEEKENSSEQEEMFNSIEENP